MSSVSERADKAREAARILAASLSENRRKALDAVANALVESRSRILAANHRDLTVARKLVDAG